MISTPFLSVPPRNYGGTELIVHELVEGLVERGHRVTLFATGDSRTSAELRFLYPEAQWPPNLMPDLNHVSWAIQSVRDEDFDLVHVHSADALAFARLLPEIPMVYTLHHVRDEDLSAFYPYFQEPHYVAISRAQAEREVPLTHLNVIHHGLDPSRFEWRAGAVEPYVVFLGRFTEVKGPHTAMEVAARAGLPIRVAGEVHAVDQEFAEREVLPRFEQPHVSYVGCVGMEEKVPLLRDARALLVPITWEEPFGLVMIEAMLSGCPVIAFPRGSVPELVEDGVTGYVVESEEEMVRTIRPGGPLDVFDRQRCRERAVERFGRDRMVEDHLALYRRILLESGGRHAAAAMDAA
ncbi:MAG TPA: glycosyltransferase family 4 protein [Longimicrobiaceae bacterium]|nr:glycosyltransferase family 4 protein [Longimicrobiaceae bacterium]